MNDALFPGTRSNAKSSPGNIISGTAEREVHHRSLTGRAMRIGFGQRLSRWFFSPIVICSLFFLALGAVEFVWPDEPTFQGRSLSAWVNDFELRTPPCGLDVEHSPREVEAAKALQQLVPQALPQLLKRLEAKDSRINLLLARLLDLQRVLRYRFEPAAEIHDRTLHALCFLPETADMSVPAIQRFLLTHGYSTRAMLTLAELGPGGINTLVQTLTNWNVRTRYDAVIALARAAAHDPGALTALIAASGDKSPRVRFLALQALGKIKQHSELLLETFQARTGDSDPAIRVSALRALGEAGTRARGALPLVRERLEDPERQVRMAATNALSRLEQPWMVALDEF